MEKLERDIFNLQALLEKLTGEEEKSDEESEEKEKEEPEIVQIEPPEEKSEPEQETKEEEPDELKKGIDEIRQGLASVLDKFDSLFEEKSEDDVDELKIAVKARDDRIDALQKKIDVLTKSEEQEKSKTVEEKDDDEKIEIEYNDDPFVVDDGDVYLRY